MLKTTLSKSKFCSIALAGFFGLMSASANAVVPLDEGPRSLQLNLDPPVTDIAHQIYNLHTMMLIICLAIFVAVFGVMFYSIYAHRKSKGHKPADFHESTTVEIIWTVIPFLIVIGMALPATKTVVAMKDTSNADLTIKATGYQWKWGYDYLAGEGEGISFLSNLATPRDEINNHRGEKTEAKDPHYLIEVDNPLVVPVDKKIRIVTTANDVIHSWMVPAFGVKQDAIPGFVRDTWFKAEKIGTFRGQCAELCGKEHAFMPIVVEVKSQADYDAWVKKKQAEMQAKNDDPTKTWSKEDLIARGKKIFNSNCAACHQANGEGIPGAFPALNGSKVVLGPEGEQIHILLNGLKGPMGQMPAWGGALSDVEIASVITYTRNAWTNAGQGKDPVVQPRAVTAAR